MTIDSIYSPVVQTINPSRNYTFSFEHIFGTILTYERDADGNDKLVTDVTITSNGTAPIYDSASVQFNQPHAAGTVSVVFIRDTTIDQTVDYQPYTPFPAETHEYALDKLTLIAQEQRSGGSGGGTGGDFIPLVGTAVGRPVTGSIEFDAFTENWRFGPIGGGFNVMTLSDLGGDGNFIISVGSDNYWTSFQANGDVTVQTVYDGNNPPNTVATIQYVLDAIGGEGADFIPLAGTEEAKPVTGIIKFNSATLSEEWGMGIAEGVTDAFTIAPTSATGGDSSLFITSGDGNTNVNNWHFKADGQLNMPDVDYAAADDLSAVSKAYVDSVAGGGDYIPLAGNVAPDFITGPLLHQDVANNVQFTQGLSSAISGFEQSYVIAATSSSSPLASVAFVTGNAAAVSWITGNGTYVGDLLNIGGQVGDDLEGYVALFTGDVGIDGGLVCGDIVCSGIFDTGGATFEGGVVIEDGPAEWDLNCKGKLLVGGDALTKSIVADGGVQATTVSQTADQVTNPGSMVRYDTWNNQTLKTSGAQTATGRKTFQDGVSSGATIVTPGINVSGGPLVGIVQPLLGGAGTRYVKVDNNGGFFASTNLIAASEVEGLDDRLQEMQDESVHLHSRILGLEAEKEQLALQIQELRSALVAKGVL